MLLLALSRNVLPRDVGGGVLGCVGGRRGMSPMHVCVRLILIRLDFFLKMARKIFSQQVYKCMGIVRLFALFQNMPLFLQLAHNFGYFFPFFFFFF